MRELILLRTLSQETQEEFSEAVGHQELGRMLSYCGAWQKAEQPSVTIMMRHLYAII